MAALSHKALRSLHFPSGNQIYLQDLFQLWIFFPYKYSLSVAFPTELQPGSYSWLTAFLFSPS